MPKQVQARPHRLPTRDTVLGDRSALPTVLACGALAALPLLLALTAITAAALVVPPMTLHVLRWLYVGCLVIVYGCIVGAGSALLSRWGYRSQRWGDLASGLLLWPASFLPVYALVVAIYAFTHGTPPRSWTDMVPDRWSAQAIEAVSLSALLATAWFGSWRFLYVRFLRRISGVDEQAIASALLREHYRDHHRGPGYRRVRPGLPANGSSSPVPPENHGPPAPIS